jgi:hypothetical protein
VSCHGRLQDPSAHLAPAVGRRPKKTQAKKTQKQRKKICCFQRGEEDPLEEDPIFNPADSLHFQNGDDSGGYLRLLPSALVRRGLNVAEKLHRPGMIYLHPWEFDPDQPVLPMGRISRWRHRVNLHRTEAKLSGLLRQFPFGPVADYLKAGPTETLERYVYTSNGRHPE